MLNGRDGAKRASDAASDLLDDGTGMQLSGHLLGHRAHSCCRVIVVITVWSIFCRTTHPPTRVVISCSMFFFLMIIIIWFIIIIIFFFFFFVFFIIIIWFISFFVVFLVVPSEPHSWNRVTNVCPLLRQLHHMPLHRLLRLRRKVMHYLMRSCEVHAAAATWHLERVGFDCCLRHCIGCRLHLRLSRLLLLLNITQLLLLK